MIFPVKNIHDEMEKHHYKEKRVKPWRKTLIKVERKCKGINSILARKGLVDRKIVKKLNQEQTFNLLKL